MKISILVFDLSSNSLVRIYPIAKVLQRHYEIEVIGPLFGSQVFEPYKNEFKYKSYPLATTKGVYSKWTRAGKFFKSISEAIEGDVIYAFKPRVLSFGVALWAHWFKKFPLVLDVEDWEAAAYYEQPFYKRGSFIASISNPTNALYDRFMEGFVRCADQVIVVSDFLQRRFGGIKISHGADCSWFDPALEDEASLRRELGLSDKKVILFAGTVRPHKGLDDLVTAIRVLNDAKVRLLIVGASNEYLESLKQSGGDFIVYAGAQPHQRIRTFLKLADLVVLPQRSTPFAEAQVPGKVFEAMAMAKPIIATSVSDLPEILDGCGWIVESGNIQELLGAIHYVLDHAEEARSAGMRARQKCLEKYSWDAMEKLLIPVFKKWEPVSAQEIKLTWSEV